MADDLAPATDTPAPAEAAQTFVLGEMAKPEDASAYIKEREDQKRAETGQADKIDHQERANRWRHAVDQARQSTAEVRQQNGLDQPPQIDLNAQLDAAQQEWQQAQVEEARYETERETARNEGRFTAHAEQLRARNPEVWAQITHQMGAVETTFNEQQIDAFKRGLTVDPKSGLAIAHRLAMPTYDDAGNMTMSPEQKIQHLAGLPPQAIEQTLRDAQMYLKIEADVAKRFEANSRRITKTPPPFRPPRGGANPPRNVAALATKENAADYIKARKAQEKNRE